MNRSHYEKVKRKAEGMRIGWKIGDVIRDAGLRDPENVYRVEDLIYGPYGLSNSMDIYYPREMFVTDEADALPSSGSDDPVTTAAAAINIQDTPKKLAGNMSSTKLLMAVDSGGNLLTGGISRKLPVIVDIHGGGWQYGDKELYKHYNMALAQHGFAVIGFNYRLAPEDAFPAEYIDVNRVFVWLAANAEKYGLDRKNVFILGDSAGSQMCAWYNTLLTSAAYRKLYEETFPLKETHRETVPFTREQYAQTLIPQRCLEDIPDDNMVPDEMYHFVVPYDKMHVRACALNCGIYDMVSSVEKGVDDAYIDFLGDMLEEDSPEGKRRNDNARSLTMKLIDSWHYQTKDFTPSFVMSASHDFLLPHAQPMYEHLKAAGAQTELHIYGTPEQKYMQHVFHVNQKLKEAHQCNEEECAFFRAHLE